MPLERESPVEASDHGLVRLHVELKAVPVDCVDHRAHNGALIFTNPGQPHVQQQHVDKGQETQVQRI